MSKMRKLITLLLALTLIFASVVPVMAVTVDTPGYTSTSATVINGVFHVKLNIQGYATYKNNILNGPIQRFYLDVTMGSANGSKSYTVKDVLEAAATQYSSILDFDINSDNDHSSYLHGIEDVATSKWYVSGAMKNIDLPNKPTYYCGWMFRINGQIPMLDSTNGALINQAYIKQNDVIDVYYANPYNQNYSTKFTQVIYDTTASSFRLLYSDLYIPTGSSNWTITSFAPVESEDISIVLDGVLLTDDFSTDEDGYFTIDGITSGSHTIKVVVNQYNLFRDVTDTSLYYYVPAFLNTYAVLSI